MGSIYEVKIIIEFTTGCTGDSKESAESKVAILLGEEMERAGIINPREPDTGLFKAKLISSVVEDLREARAGGEA